MKNCKGIIGLILGHDFKEMRETKHLPFDENSQAAFKAVRNINFSDRDKALNKILEGRVDIKTIGVYCTRCGIEQYLNEYV